MSENNDEIEKIFNELMSSNSIKDVVQEDRFSVIKELILIQESLLESSINVNGLIHAMNVDESFEVDPQLFELLGPLYKISEDFIAEAAGYHDTIVDEQDDDEEKEQDNGGE